jgi:anaerobic ribonucleoside-triphosphate reductase activating protein
MNYLAITKSEVANGIGIRAALWCAGCNHMCKGCHNENSWDCYGGKLFTEDTFKILVDELSKDYVRGLTFSGGDPLFPKNREEVLNIAKRIKFIYPNKDIWLWTGYSWNEIKDLENIDYINVLVDGVYIEEKRDITLAWRGSSNQNVIDVKKSIESGNMALYCD